MRIIACMPVDDQFWVGCNEAIKILLPLLSQEEKDNYFKIYRDHNIQQKSYCKMAKRGMETKDVFHACFNISRDLSVCFPHFPHFPLANLWNAYSPFRLMDQKDISTLDEKIRECITPAA